MDKIVLITDNDNIKNLIKENLVLLRQTDKLLAVGYDNATEVLYELRPDILLLQENEDKTKTFDIIEFVKSKRIFQNTCIILLVNNPDKEFILNAYDAGIEDYLPVSAEPAEMLIRTINCIKKANLKSKLARQDIYLQNYGILDAGTQFYSSNFARDIFGAELINNNCEGCSFMVIAPAEDTIETFSESILQNAIKSSIRNDDIVAGGQGAKYSLLLHTNVEGAITVFEKIKEKIENKFSLKAGLVNVDSRKYADIENKALYALRSAQMSKAEYSVFSPEKVSEDDWLAVPEKKQKNYKFFQKVYNNKVDKVIAPVFYRFQQSYDTKLGDTKIEQLTDETRCIFRLINNKRESKLMIVSPGFSRFVVMIEHSGLDTPENREFSLPISLLSQQEVSRIVQDFIDEFSECNLVK